MMKGKTVIVQMADGTKDILTMRVEIPDSVKISKEMLTWQVGDPLETQLFDVSVLEPGAKVKSVKAWVPIFTPNLPKSKRGRSIVSTSRP